jgi:serine/threonine-protein kinase
MSSGYKRGSAFLAVICFGRAALGQAANDQTLAEALFQEGRKLVDERRYAEACPKFAESQRLDPGIGTLLNLATCHELQGKIASAWAEFTQALGLASREARASAQQLARSHLDAITPKLPKIVVSVPAENEVPSLEVRLDGQTIGKPAWGVAAPIDPGPHSLAASAPGRRAWTSEVVFVVSEPKTVVIPLLEPEAAPAPAPIVAAAPAPVEPPALSPVISDDKPDETRRTFALVLGGAGAATMGTGIVLGLLAKSRYTDSAGYCDASGGCDPPGLDIRESAVRRGNVATVVFGLGAAGTIGGAVLWLTAPQKPSTVSLGLGHNGVVLRETW